MCIFNMMENNRNFGWPDFTYVIGNLWNIRLVMVHLKNDSELHLSIFIILANFTCNTFYNEVIL